MSEWQPAIIAPYPGTPHHEDDQPEHWKKIAGERIRVKPYVGPHMHTCGGFVVLVHPDDVKRIAYDPVHLTQTACEHMILTD